MSGKRLLRVRLSLKGRPIRTYKFTKDSVTIGRNPASDIFLDNAGVSRDHCVIERANDGGHVLVDQASANGTFLNDKPVKREYLQSEDVVRIGKFSLWLSYEEDKREEGPIAHMASPHTFEGTTVLRTGELQEMIDASRHAEPAEPRTATTAVSRDIRVAGSRRVDSLVVTVAVVFFMLGSALGASAVWYLFR